MLDTHALVWWVSNPSRIPARARQRIDEVVSAGDQLVVSSISVWEVAMLVDRARLELRIPVDAWIASVEALPFLEFIPVDNRIALRSVVLEGFAHRDPADRMILATALGLGATLVTADARLHRFKAVKTVWTTSS
jgi:PIN domain nuclease of toxin-antitoxin system